MGRVPKLELSTRRRGATESIAKLRSRPRIERALFTMMQSGVEEKREAGRERRGRTGGAVVVARTQDGRDAPALRRILDQHLAERGVGAEPPKRTPFQTGSNTGAETANSSSPFDSDK